MTEKTSVSTDGETITIHIPMTFKKRGGRKTIVTPDGATWAPRARMDTAIVKAVARAFRWRRMLDEGVFATHDDLAKAEKVERSYVTRLLPLTLLAPDIVEAIVHGRQQDGIQLEHLLQNYSMLWETQRETLLRRRSAEESQARDSGCL